MGQGLGGLKVLTVSGEVGAVGKPVRVYTVIALSGGTAGNSTLKNNGSSGTTYFTAICPTVSTDNIFTLGERGMLFPQGCYWTKDANTTNIKVSYEQEL